jgi:hypothetical protein
MIVVQQTYHLLGLESLGESYFQPFRLAAERYLPVAASRIVLLLLYVFFHGHGQFTV